MNAIMITPSGPAQGTVRPPGSKSITNRALVCAALADGPSLLTGALDSDDTRVMTDCLARLGVSCDWSVDGTTIRIDGRGGDFPQDGVELYTENSGTTMRFLTAVTTLGHGHYRLDGNRRMRCRPIGDLVHTLTQLGIAIRCEEENDCPPVILQSNGLPGGEVTIAGSVSSQFLSGLLLAAPHASSPLTIRLTDAAVSTPYIDMTAHVMRAFGVDIERHSDRDFRVIPQRFQPVQYAIEPDATAASYFWGAAAITHGKVTVDGLNRASIQGDTAFVDALGQMGCSIEETGYGLTAQGAPLSGIDIDMRDISDTVPTLAVVALFADRPTTIRGVAHIRLKESDRIGDLARELKKLGAVVDELADGLRITPGPLHGATLRTYDDHRLAMAFSLIGSRIPGVTILDPACTAKTYPRFFDDLQQIGIRPARQANDV